MKRKNDKRYFVIALLFTILFITVGYAAFSESLNISGTASTSGTFDVAITSATITESGSTGATVDYTGGNTLTLSAPNLEAPGSYVEYTVTVTNQGSIPARLSGVTVNADTSDADLYLTEPTWDTVTVLNNSDTYVFVIRVEWDGLSSTGGKSISYSLDLNYVQS